jgi:hypothetical protein
VCARVRARVVHVHPSVQAVQVPDVYGVFKYYIDYAHRGYSYIKLTHQV